MRWRFGLTTAVGVVCMCTCVSCARTRTVSYSEGCFGNARPEDQPRPFRPGTFVYETPEQEQIADRLFRLSAPFRACAAFPDWENLIIEQVEVLELRKEKDRSNSRGLAGTDRVHFGFLTGDGLAVSIQFDPQDGVLRSYWYDGVSERVRDDLENDRWVMTGLSPQEALAKSREYVRLAKGSFPDDLVAVSVRYDEPPDEFYREEHEDWARWIDSSTCAWKISFQRYSGRMRYGGGGLTTLPGVEGITLNFPEGITLAFSEQYGIHYYHDNYSSETWQGNIKVTQEKAIEISAPLAKAYFDEDEYEYELVRPPYVFEGRPVLMNVVEDNPRAVHAVWVVVYPYSNFSYADWRAVFYVDAETGEVIPRPQVHH